MKFRTDFVTNSSSSGFVVITVDFKDGGFFEVREEYDSGYGGYFWNGGDFRGDLLKAKSGADVIKAIISNTEGAEFIQHAHGFDRLEEKLNDTVSVVEINRIRMQEETRFDDGDKRKFKIDFRFPQQSLKGAEQFIIKNGVLTKFIGKSRKVVIPDGVTEIGDRAFFDCKFLTGISIPDSITKIGDSAFSGCKLLTGISIPGNVKKIGDAAFSGCAALNTIKVAQGNPVYHSAENCLIETESKKIILGCCTSVIPADGSVTYIAPRAFSGCSTLTSIIIPDNIAKIGWNAFSGCSALAEITLPADITEIGSSVFRGCSSLKNFAIPNSVSWIGYYAFSECSSLTDVIVPASVVEIGKDAFSGCPRLTLRGAVKSVAEKYAKKNKIPFEPV